MRSETATTIDTALGATARAFRKLRRMTLAQVCGATAARGHTLHVAELSRLERGLHRWNTDRLAAVAAGLGVSPFNIMSTRLQLEEAGA